MTMVFNPGLIPTSTISSNNIDNSYNINNSYNFTDVQSARSMGPISPYQYKSLKTKKQLKELRAVLMPQKKKFLFFKYSFAYNINHRCVICGVQHNWEASDELRPPIPLSNVEKGRPLKGTYCPKHASIYKQLEMLEQQILAEKHGLEFKKFIPKPKMPTLNRGPLNDLRPQDITSLIAAGWLIQPPQGTKENPVEQYSRLMFEIQGKLNQIQKIIPMMEVEQNG